MKEALLNYVKRVKVIHERVKGTEQGTKHSLIGPLFTLLGYDLADPEECVPEFKADFGKDRSAKPVDWAFYQNGRPIFLVEAKEAGRKLGGYDEQLGDYFAKVPGVKLGMLTNGVMWWFFTDLTNAHLMDKEPFLEWDVLNDDQPPYDFLTLLQKSEFKTEFVRTFAERQRQHDRLVKELARLLEPSTEFTRLAIENIEKRRTDKVVESWKPVVASAIAEWAKQRTHPTILVQSPSQDEANAPPQRAGKQDRRSMTLAELIAAGILAPPLKLFRRYKGKKLEGRLLPDGAVEFEQHRYDSCSAAAEAARATVVGRRMNTNGWSFWQYHGTSGETLTLADARKRLARSTGALKTDSTLDQVDKPERYDLRRRFWEGLLSRPKVKTTRHANKSPGEFSWIGAGSGVRGLPFVYAIGRNEGRVELYIDRGAGRAAENKGIYDRMVRHKAEIERAFGGALSWQRLDDKQGCRVAYTVPGGGWKSDQSKWPGIQDAMIEAMIRLEKAVAPQLARLKEELASEGA